MSNITKKRIGETEVSICTIGAALLKRRININIENIDCIIIKNYLDQKNSSWVAVDTDDPECIPEALIVDYCSCLDFWNRPQEGPFAATGSTPTEAVENLCKFINDIKENLLKDGE